MRDHLAAGIAIFNAGQYHPAHDAWEEQWLSLAKGTDDERLLHGLIQYTAAVYHLSRDNAEGATGLAESARKYLEELDDRYRQVELGPIRSSLGAILEDPEGVEPGELARLRLSGRRLTPSDLEGNALGIATRIIAEDVDGRVDERDIEDAIERASRGEEPYLTLLRSFVGRPDLRELLADRLSAHLDRDRQNERTLEGLFEGSDQSS